MRALSSIQRLCDLECGVGVRGREDGSVAHTHKGADPVTSPISEHRFTVFATRYKQIGPIVLERRERELCYRSSVTAVGMSKQISK